jgi:hypothetical protein
MFSGFATDEPPNLMIFINEKTWNSYWKRMIGLTMASGSEH